MLVDENCGPALTTRRRDEAFVSVYGSHVRVVEKVPVDWAAVRAKAAAVITAVVRSFFIWRGVDSRSRVDSRLLM